ncbi:acyl-CoA reductase [Amycolatopsis lurida]
MKHVLDHQRSSLSHGCGANRHFWRGAWLDEDEVDRRIGALGRTARAVLDGARLNPLVVVAACGRLRALLNAPRTDLRGRLTDRLRARNISGAKIDRVFTDLLTALPRLTHTGFHGRAAEARLHTHIVAGSEPAVGALSALEGLLSGHFNVVKTSRDDSLFTAELLAGLAGQDVTGQIAARVVVLRFSAVERRDWMSQICDPADTVAVCGPRFTYSHPAAPN